MPNPTQQSAFAAQIDALGRPQDIRALPLSGLRLVVALRLCAQFERAARDPVPELAQRFRSTEAACAVHDLIVTVVDSWPEPFTFNGPCCLSLSPDEATLAAMSRAALHADHAGFFRSIDGFVRQDRQQALYNSTLHAVALLSATPA